MQLHLLAFYAGPDQVMTVTSGLASVLGVVLIFWNKVVAGFTRIMNKIRGTSTEPQPPASSKDVQTS